MSVASMRRTGRGPSMAIIGAGVAGIGLAVRLRQAGFGNLTLLERRPRLGGPDPAAGDAGDPAGGLLRDHAERAGLMPHIRFGADVRGATLDAASGRWLLTFAGGGTWEADLLVSARGQLPRQAVPAVTGPAGGADHPMAARPGSDPVGRRVAVIGTGVGALRYAPQLVPDVTALAVFPVGGQPLPRALPAPVRPAPGAVVPAGARIVLGGDSNPPLPDGFAGTVTERVEQVLPDAVLTADGIRHGADTVIFATGFTAAEFLAPVHAWDASGQGLPRAWPGVSGVFLWLSVAGYPNLFLLHRAQRPWRDRIRTAVPAPSHRVVRGAGVFTSR